MELRAGCVGPHQKNQPRHTRSSHWGLNQVKRATALRAPFRALQRLHAAPKLASSSLPPAPFGTLSSTSDPCPPPPAVHTPPTITVQHPRPQRHPHRPPLPQPPHQSSAYGEHGYSASD